MAIKLNKEGEFVFDTVDEAVSFEQKRQESPLKEVTMDVNITHVTEASTPTPTMHGEHFDDKELNFIRDFVERHTVGSRLKRGKLGELAETLGRTKLAIKDVVKRMKKGLVVSKGIAPKSQVEKPAEKRKYKKRKTKAHGKWWTKEADTELIEERKKYLLKTGRIATGSVKKIAKKTGRSVHAIHMRLYDLKNKGKF